ncbi:MAG: hypothetical protein WKF30_13455 [Pyrinomonadaceae bacterium]
MSKSLTEILAALLIIFSATGIATADAKITTRTTSGGQILESTTYLKGARQRSESTASGVSELLLCDRQQRVQLNDSTKLYLAASTIDEGGGGAAPEAAAPPLAAPIGQAADAQAAQAAKKNGVVTYMSTTTETGERKLMIGFAARRLKSSMVSEPSPDACNQEIMRAESDGWYIDLEDGAECPASAPNYQWASIGEQAAGCQDALRFKQTGTGKLGYPAMVTTTFYMKDGRASQAPERSWRLRQRRLMPHCSRRPRAINRPKASKT